MARQRKPNGTGGDAVTRRITAPISDTLFRRVGAYRAWRGLPLGDVVEAALEAYLKARDFRLGGGAADDQQDAA